MLGTGPAHRRRLPHDRVLLRGLPTPPPAERPRQRLDLTDADPNSLTGPVKGVDEVMTVNSACLREVAGIR
ncbi:hypothetical protein [Umezawaea sp.]|uniref:hypothetical protein n=1 Tax=Umezawaea sp. TaxID=1955258 RepID=UPI002ED5A855